MKTLTYLRLSATFAAATMLLIGWYIVSGSTDRWPAAVHTVVSLAVLIAALFIKQRTYGHMLASLLIYASITISYIAPWRGFTSGFGLGIWATLTLLMTLSAIHTFRKFNVQPTTTFHELINTPLGSRGVS